MLTLYRHRDKVLWTNTELFLLRGLKSIFTSVGMESLLGSRDWFSQALAPNNFSVAAIGQASLRGKGARLNWVMSTQATNEDPLPKLIDHMNLEAGARGARFITAGARVEDCLFETLRRAGYCRYGWQCFWRILPSITRSQQKGKSYWRAAGSEDSFNLVALQRRLLAPAVQSITEFASERLPDYVFFEGNRLCGYAAIDHFDGICLVKPVMHSDSGDGVAILASLIHDFIPNTQTVLVLQTSDQGWLTDSLGKIAETIMPREELLVKHFALMEKLPVAGLNQAQNGRRTDTITPLMPSAKNGEH